MAKYFAKDGGIFDENNNLIGYWHKDGGIFDLNNNLIGYHNKKVNSIFNLKNAFIEYNRYEKD